MTNSSSAPELLNARVLSREDMTSLYLELEGPIPSVGAFLIGVFVSSGEGKLTQIGAKFLDGELIANFAFNNTNATQENFALENVESVGNVIRISFPSSLVVEPLDPRQIRPFVNHEGDDIGGNVDVEIVDERY